MKRIYLALLLFVVGQPLFSQDCDIATTLLIPIDWECDCVNDQAFVTIYNAYPANAEEFGLDPNVTFTANNIPLTDSLNFISVPIGPSFFFIDFASSDGCTWSTPFDTYSPGLNMELACLDGGHSNCVNDGNCSNGIETFDADSCECIQVPTIEGCVVPAACNYNPLANCPTECIFESLPFGQSCDDGDPNTVGDFINCDGLCAGISCVDIESNCVDDGIPSNGVEVYDSADCSCSSEAPSYGCTDISACNFDPIANINFGCEYVGQTCFAGFTQGVGIVSDDCNCIQDPNAVFCDESVNIQSAFSCEPGTGFTYQLWLFNSSDPLATYQMSGTGIIGSLSLTSYAELDLSLDPLAELSFVEGTAVDWIFTDASGCIAGTYSSGGPLACSLIPVGAPCDDNNPNTFDDAYLTYGCHGTPCNLNAFACPDDGDCSNGFETFDLENCECISVGDCSDVQVECNPLVEVVTMTDTSPPFALIVVSGEPNTSYTVFVNEDEFVNTSSEFGTFDIQVPLTCPDPFQYTILVSPTGSSCDPAMGLAICGGLPITLIEFDGLVSDKRNKIFWSTGSESNSDYFSVERSANGENNWRPVGTVSAFGNSNSRKDYTFWDDNPLDQTSYYRLKEHDLDGNIKIVSQVIALKRSDASNIPIYPIPTNDLLFIDFDSLPSGTAEIELRTLEGRLVLGRTVSNQDSNIALDLSDFRAGYYLLRVNHTRGVESLKVLKY